MTILRRSLAVAADPGAAGVEPRAGLRRHLGWAALAAHEAALRRLVAAAPLLAGAGLLRRLCAGGCAVACRSARCSRVGGGLLFGTAAGGALAVAAASSGAVLLFLRRAGRWRRCSPAAPVR